MSGAARLARIRLALQRAGGRLPGPVRRLAGRIVRSGAAAAAEVTLDDWSNTLIGGRPMVWPERTAAHAGPAPVPAAAAPDVRCLLVTESLDAGGMDEFVAFLARGLPARGVEAAVMIAPVGVPRGIGPIGQDLRASGITVVEPGDEAEAWIAAWRPDVISVHGNADAPIVIGERLGIPVALVLHGMHDLLDMPEVEVLRRYDRLAAVLSVSELVRQQYLAISSRIDPARVHTIPNGVDPRRTSGADRAASRAALGLEDEFLLVSLSRHSMQKNTFGLLAAFGEAAADRPRAHLVVCGRVDDAEYARQVLALRDRMPARERVHLRTNTTRPDVLLAAADAFVLDSFFEGWALASMEALAAGVPVIMSEVGGSREQLTGGPARGRLVLNPLGDPIAVTWESMARARFAAQVNRGELVAALRAAIDGGLEVAPAAEIAADAVERFSAARCLDRHAWAIAALAERRPLVDAI
jgi:glycosyltransferase involved in cell wall biosynthesis